VNGSKGGKRKGEVYRVSRSSKKGRMRFWQRVRRGNGEKGREQGSVQGSRASGGKHLQKGGEWSFDGNEQKEGKTEKGDGAADWGGKG